MGKRSCSNRSSLETQYNLAMDMFKLVTNKGFMKNFKRPRDEADEEKDDKYSNQICAYELRKIDECKKKRLLPSWCLFELEMYKDCARKEILNKAKEEDLAKQREKEEN